MVRPKMLVALALVVALASQLPAAQSKRLRFVVPVAGGAATNPIEGPRQPLGSTAVPNAGWALAGATIVTGRSQCGGTIAAYAGTAGTINTAISSCSSGGGGKVVLGAGTFNVSTTVVMKSNVTLAGQGMSTILSFTNMGGSGFYWGAGETGLIFQGDFDSSGDANPPGQGGTTAANIKTWSGTGGTANIYTQAATVINLSAAPTGLTANTMLTLWQLDEASGSTPHTGLFVSEKTDHSGSATPVGASWQGSGQSNGSSLQQRVKVVSIGADGTCGTCAVTVTPGIFMPTGAFKTANTPKIAWQGNDIRSAGLEDLLIRSTAYAADQWSLVQFWQASDCWIARVALQPRFTSFQAGGATQNVIQIYESRNITVRDNWMDHAIGGGQGSTTTYGISTNLSSNSLIENNIFDTVESPMMHNNGATGNVYAYNYEINGSQEEGGIQYHEVGVAMNLNEGNETKKIMGDLFHGSANFQTIFRNHTYDTGDANIDAWSYHRFWNVLGNVLGATAGNTTLSSDVTKHSRFEGYCFRLGYNGQNATINVNDNGNPNIGVVHDPEVATSMLRWGNYCAADGTTAFTSAQVPTADPAFPNSVPSTQTLPASFVHASRPPWFTLGAPISVTVTWPPIGPDVTGGTAAGGRVYKLPAQLVYEAASGVITSFNASLYGT